MKQKLITIIFPLLFVFCCGSILVITTGDYDTTYCGFAIDDNNNVYVGCKNEIKVYKENEYRYSIISPMTSRGYSFTIVEDELLIQNGGFTQVFVENNDSIYFYKTDISNYERIIPNNKEFVNDSGKCFKKKSNLGRTQIIDTQRNEIVFEMPEKDYYSRILLLFSVVCFSGLTIFVVFKVNQSKTIRYRFKTTDTNQGNQSGDGSVIEP